MVGDQTGAATLLAASRPMRVISIIRIFILSNLHFNYLNFSKRSIFIINSKALHSLAGLIGITAALFLILFPSPACAQHVTLAWDSNDEPGLAGYIVYYGTQSRYYDYDVDVGHHNSVTISGLAEDVTYYFAVTAYDSEGNDSGFSQEIVFPRTSTFSASDTSGGGAGGCFVTVASDNSPNSDQNEMLKKFAVIALVISLLITALLSHRVPLTRTEEPVS